MNKIVKSNINTKTSSLLRFPNAHTPKIEIDNKNKQFLF